MILPPRSPASSRALLLLLAVVGAIVFATCTIFYAWHPLERWPVTVAEERMAVESIRRLGGWYRVDDDKHVVEVNMVYFDTGYKIRYDNVQSDTDENMRFVENLQHLEVFFIWDARSISDVGVRHLS